MGLMFPKCLKNWKMKYLPKMSLKRKELSAKLFAMKKVSAKLIARKELRPKLFARKEQSASKKILRRKKKMAQLKKELLPNRLKAKKMQKKTKVLLVERPGRLQVMGKQQRPRRLEKSQSSFCPLWPQFNE